MVKHPHGFRKRAGGLRYRMEKRAGFKASPTFLLFGCFLGRGSRGSLGGCFFSFGDSFCDLGC